MNKTALSQLGGFNCTNEYHSMRPLFPNCVVTDGVRFLAENADCFWLLTDICALQQHPAIHKDERLQSMQFWTLRKNEVPPVPAPLTTAGLLEHMKPVNRAMATLICERDTDDVAYSVNIPYTDFPFDVVPNPRIWVAPTQLGDSVSNLIKGKVPRIVKVLYLPSEH